MESEKYKQDNVYPCIVPNWDHSARRGRNATILQDSTPELFKKHIESVLDLIKDKKDEDKIVILKSWNEWGEGNYVEPDLKYGKGYLKAIKEAISND